MSDTDSEATYVDAKGRRRWKVNDQVADAVRDLGDFLIVAGYEPSHATRYNRLAHTISRYPDSVQELQQKGRLRELPGVGPTIAGILDELIRTGSCGKLREWAAHTPLTVLELTRVPGLGPLKVRGLYRDLGIDSLESLRQALDQGRLDNVPGLGPATLQRLREAAGGKDRSN